MKHFLQVMLVIIFASVPIGAADQQIWTGTISDSQCGTNHEGELNETDCTLRCIQLGFRYVLVADGKVLKIENQGFADLKAHAGHTVKVTGELKGDTIIVSKIEMPAKSK
jgi:hypothetical protein